MNNLKKVVIIDLDLHKPKQATAWNMPNDIGVTSFIPVFIPFVQAYVLAPPAVNVAVSPEQINVLLIVVVTVGKLFTVIIIVSESEHPFASVPTIL